MSPETSTVIVGKNKSACKYCTGYQNQMEKERFGKKPNKTAIKEYHAGDDIATLCGFLFGLVRDESVLQVTTHVLLWK